MPVWMSITLLLLGFIRNGWDLIIAGSLVLLGVAADAWQFVTWTWACDSVRKYNAALEEEERRQALLNKLRP